MLFSREDPTLATAHYTARLKVLTLRMGRRAHASIREDFLIPRFSG
jgi:hypothetical protein